MSEATTRTGVAEAARLLYRVADAGDIPVIREIRAAVRENRLSDPERVPATMVADYLTILGKGWVCERDGVVVGFSFAATRSQSIWALFVLPEHEGRGIGKELLALASGWLFAGGALQVVLSTAPDTRADGFYRKQGWLRGALLANGEVFYSLQRSDDRH
jgi:GNAT superfamily N-acetyltransferase